ncbi:hypothetical protein B0H14DRAFT_3424843 [Mycena olivaceomarginata]|nr:hypothetical protein B0H14DRAFT_3424843 [Mycena olivaceomarginata]
MTVLHEILQSEVPNRNVKISIFRGFGDIAMALHSPFLLTLMDYVKQLREGILEAYTSLVGGFKGTDKA